MTGAMYAAISGLKAHMQKLNVIGNNVANVNTYGYKAGTTTFIESIYTTVAAGSNGNTVSGGTNPSQIGYGSSVGSIDLDMSTKSFAPTGKDLHSMIAGDGFYLVGDKGQEITSDNISSLRLSRVGDFRFDEDGYLVDGRGFVVYGYLTATGTEGGGLKNDYVNGNNANQTKGVSTELMPIRLPLAAKAGTKDDEGVNKEGGAVYPYVDDTGKTHQPTIDNNNAGGNAIATENCIAIQGASVDKNGMITVINDDTGDVEVVGYLALGKVDNPSGVTHLEGPYYQAMGGAGDVRAGSPNGSIQGYLNNKVAPAAGGGGGNANEAEPNDKILGGSESKLVPSGLESSGTDVATEFSEMITTQRGYQANTRIVTVTDTMLEELVNMKR